jgi:hypothetical protein
MVNIYGVWVYAWIDVCVGWMRVRWLMKGRPLGTLQQAHRQVKYMHHQTGIGIFSKHTHTR